MRNRTGARPPMTGAAQPQDQPRLVVEGGEEPVWTERFLRRLMQAMPEERPQVEREVGDELWRELLGTVPAPLV